MYDKPRTPLDEIPASTDVLIVGGGPVGSLLACLLARRGIPTVLVERQTGLQRDFRGETIASPSVSAMRRLGFGPALDAHGYLSTESVLTRFEGRPAFRLDYGRLGRGTLPIDIPQPGLINIFNTAASGLPGFSYLAGWSFNDLVTDDADTVTGAVLKSPLGRRTIRARIVIGADGRFSRVRKAAQLPAEIEPMERDFLSFLLPRPPEWGNRAELVVSGGRHLVVLPTFPDKLRVGINLPKRGFSDLKQEGFEAFQNSIGELDPRLAPLVTDHLRSWDDCGYLDIFTAEMDRWSRDGLLLIGDAAHTSTPILGQGVNLGMKDAVEVVAPLARALTATPGGLPLPARHFDEFVAARRRHKNRVTRFQRVQERQLALTSPRDLALRRARFRVLDTVPYLKYALIGRSINTPFEIDPLDERLASRPTSVPTAV